MYDEDHIIMELAVIISWNRD